MRRLAFPLLLAVLLTACSIRTDPPVLDGRDVSVRFVHTTDIHSRLLPYRMKVSRNDEMLGLDPDGGPYGGISRVSWVAKNERSQSERSLHIDTGDVFQGAPIFNLFQGEPEMLALSYMGVDVSVLGNHEFDSGEANVADKIKRFTTFPLLAANYLIEPVGGATEPPLRGLVYPYQIFNLKGLRVGVIGLANTSTMNSLYEAGNSMGINPLEAAETAQFYIDMLRPQVDVIVIASHLGLTSDEELIPCIAGADLVLGGHHHVVLNPPKQILDAGECFYAQNTDFVRKVCEDEYRRAFAEDGSVAAARLEGACDVITDETLKFFGTFREEPGRVLPVMDRDSVFQACVESLAGDLEIPDVMAGDLTAVSEYIDSWVSFKCYSLPKKTGWTQPARRLVPLAHSGVFARYVGVIDLVFHQSSACADGMDNDLDGLSDMDDPDCGESELDNSEGQAGYQVSADWDMASIRHKVIAIDASVPEDPAMNRLLEPYVDELNQKIPLTQILGYAPAAISRFGSNGGDSAIGNAVAESMMARPGVETDFALTNSLGIRSDLYRGPITIEWMYNVFPFENTITTMYLSGREVIEMFDFIARRSSDRGCKTQAQVAGVTAILQCGRCDNARRSASGFPEADPDRACALEIKIGGVPIRLDAQYQLAANDYIAAGGSGFTVLKRNTTQVNTGISLRESLSDFIRQGRACGFQDGIGGLVPCTNGGAGAGGCDAGYQCACEARSIWDSVAGVCVEGDTCPEGEGFCVPSNCVTDVLQLFEDDNCLAFEDGVVRDECMCRQGARANAQCTTTSCVDRTNAFKEDGRLLLLAP